MSPSSPSFPASARYVSCGHFVLFRSSSLTRNFSSPLPASICRISFFLNTSLVFYAACIIMPCALVLPSMLAEFPIIWASGRLSSFAFRMRLTAPMTTIDGSVTVTRSAVRVSEEMRENTRICFFLFFNCLVSVRVLS